jgi:hypothetical protein
MAWRTVALLIWATTVLTACTSKLLGFLAGGGPNVAANGQIGATNNQLSTSTQLDAQTIETLTVNNTDYTMLIMLLLAVAVGVAGWIAPQPTFLRRWKK